MSDRTSGHGMNAQSDAADTAGVRAENDASEPLDRAVLEQLRALQPPGEPDMLQQLSDLYIEDAGRLLAVLGDALNRDDAKTLHHTAHTLKSSSGSLGAKRLAAYFERLELMGRCGTLCDAPAALHAAQSEFIAVCSALKAARGATDRPRPEPTLSRRRARAA